MQGALAAGLLGGGSRFLGVTEDAGRFLAAALAGHAQPAASCPTPTRAGTTWPATPCARSARPAGYVPGLGHHVHKAGDPRTPVLFRIAAEEGVLGPHLRLFEAVGRVHPEVLGRTLPLNGAGVCGAALCDLGFPSRSCAASRCWPAPPACSGTSPRRCAARSAWPIYEPGRPGDRLRSRPDSRVARR